MPDSLKVTACSTHHHVLKIRLQHSRGDQWTAGRVIYKGTCNPEDPAGWLASLGEESTCVSYTTRFALGGFNLKLSPTSARPIWVTDDMMDDT